RRSRRTCSAGSVGGGGVPTPSPGRRPSPVRPLSSQPPIPAFLTPGYVRAVLLGSRDGRREFLLVDLDLQLLERFVEAGAEALARCERRREVPHALDDADGVVVHRRLRIARVVGHPVENG